MKNLLPISIILAFLTGCSTAGPYVTNISSDGTGGLTIEKCMLSFNGWTGQISNADCTNTNIHLSK